MNQAHGIQTSNDDTCKQLEQLVSEIRDTLNAD